MRIGEVVMLPWARIEVPMLAWHDGHDEPVESIYALKGPWLGHDTANYLYVEPAVEPGVVEPPDQRLAFAAIVVLVVGGAQWAYRRRRAGDAEPPARCG
jgi:hypothetical protein